MIDKSDTSYSRCDIRLYLYRALKNIQELPGVLSIRMPI